MAIVVAYFQVETGHNRQLLQWQLLCGLLIRITVITLDFRATQMFGSGEHSKTIVQRDWLCIRLAGVWIDQIETKVPDGILHWADATVDEIKSVGSKSTQRSLYPQAWQTTSDWRLPVKILSMMQLHCLLVEMSLIPVQGKRIVKKCQRLGKRFTGWVAVKNIESGDEKFMSILLLVAGQVFRMGPHQMQQPIWNVWIVLAGIELHKEVAVSFEHLTIDSYLLYQLGHFTNQTLGRVDKFAIMLIGEEIVSQWRSVNQSLYDAVHETSAAQID